MAKGKATDYLNFPFYFMICSTFLTSFNLFYLFVLKRWQWWDIIAKEVILKTLIIHFHLASLFHFILWIQYVRPYRLWSKKGLIRFFKWFCSVFTMDGLDKECDNDWACKPIKYSYFCAVICWCTPGLKGSLVFSLILFLI